MHNFSPPECLAASIIVHWTVQGCEIEPHLAKCLSIDFLRQPFVVERTPAWIKKRQAPLDHPTETAILLDFTLGIHHI